MRLYSLLLFAVGQVACNNNQAPVEAEEATAVRDTPQQVKDQLQPPPNDSVPFNIQIDTVIHFSFSSDTAELSAKGSLNKNSDPVVCYLPIDKKKKLSAKIIPADSELNIRFSQIILPDKKTDGPFGRELNYTLPQPGMYKFIIAPNSMAEGKRSGDFVVTLQVKDY